MYLSNMNNLPEYLDFAATTPVDPRVKEVMLPYFDEVFGNASSQHIYGRQAKQAIDNARRQVADIIQAESPEIIFTSGSTEAINLAIKGYVEANSDKGNHIITVKTEHKAVLSTCEYLQDKGIEVTYLDVDKNGLISLDELESHIRLTTILIVVMLVNNEIGVIQNIKAIGKIAREKSVCFFTDATQAVGKIPVDVEHVDMLCFSGHKLGGPKGIGALYVRKGIKLTPLIHGGGQERGLRGGTYNTPLIVGFGKACELALEEFEANQERTLKQRRELIEYYESTKIGTINFNDVPHAPHILSITLNNLEADEFLIQHAKNFVASTGSACNASVIEVSHVIQTLFPNIVRNEILRISF